MHCFNLDALFSTTCSETRAGYADLLNHRKAYSQRLGEFIWFAMVGVGDGVGGMYVFMFNPRFEQDQLHNSNYIIFEHNELIFHSLLNKTAFAFFDTNEALLIGVGITSSLVLYHKFVALSLTSQM